MNCKLCNREMVHSWAHEFGNIYDCLCDGDKISYQYNAFNAHDSRWYYQDQYTFHVANYWQHHRYYVTVMHYNTKFQRNDIWLQYSQPGQMDVTLLEQEVGVYSGASVGLHGGELLLIEEKALSAMDEEELKRQLRYEAACQREAKELFYG